MQFCASCTNSGMDIMVESRMVFLAYVSGHMLGEGGSHAWVEVLLPAATCGTLSPIAFAPTNRRRPNLG